MAAPICSAANRIAAVSANPGSAPMSAVSCGSTRASLRVRSMVSTGCAVKLVQRLSVLPSAAITMSAMPPFTT